MTDLSDEFKKVALASILLFLIPFFNYLWADFIGAQHCFEWVSHVVNSEGKARVFINFDATTDCNNYCYSTSWHVKMFTDRIKYVIYLLVAAIIQPDFKRVLGINLWWFYILFEVTQVVDYRLFFNQLPYIEHFSYFLFTYQVFYVAAYFWRFELDKFR